MEGLLQTGAALTAVRIADSDPDLFAGLGEDRGRAAQLAVARRLTIEPGDWSFTRTAATVEAVAKLRDQSGALGLLLLEGLMWREVSIGRDSGIELLGPGDLVRPWVEPVPASEVLTDPQWTALGPSSMAILDQRFATAMARWPSVFATLMDRLILRSRWLSFHLAICHVRNLQERILLAMWHFADRWGRVAPDGIVVPVHLPHRMLAQLVGARRPSVTTALAGLREQGALVEREDGSWLLRGEAPPELRPPDEPAAY
jgi:CRP/FNR family cyclic AMP-dependent transcriptional regulator